MSKGGVTLWQYNYSSELYHYGVLGMKWGVRRYQNEDGTLTEAGRKYLEKKDIKWAKKNYNKITSATRKRVSKDLDQYTYELMKDPSSRNAYNRKMAELMNVAAKDITTPSGKAIRFVAKRGDIGVHMAVADQGYNMEQLKNGVWASGRIAYKKSQVNTA